MKFIYWLLARANDARALARGPVPFVKRRVRARAYAKTFGLLWRLFRAVGL